MKLLCNLPLECFEPGVRQGPIEVVTYGPADRMWVDGRHYPFDIGFDPSRGTIEELIALLPAGFWPDALLVWWPDQEPLPKNLERSPVPVVGVLSDYNISLPYVSGLWPFFDRLLVDRGGVDLFQRLSFADVRYFCQFTFKAASHRLYDDVERDVDVAFAGNLNPVVQRERAPWIERLLRLRERGVRVAVRSGIFGEGYGRFLNRARIGWNRSVRGEMNLRAFEVPACGALLMMEESNREVRDFLLPNEEVLLYGEHDFEDVVLDALRDDARCRRIAAAGHARIQDFAMSKRLPLLAALATEPGPGRPSCTAFDCALGRGVAMLATWARGAGVLDCLSAAAHLAPMDPRPLNALALALLREDVNRHRDTIVSLLKKACLLSPTYVPAPLNLAWFLAAAGRDDLAAHFRESLDHRLHNPLDWPDLDGPILPLGFSAPALTVAAALATAIRTNDLGKYLGAWEAGSKAAGS